jgi:hypothetical protein
MSTNYVYLRPKTSGDPYTVGFYRPNGQWEPESDHNSPDDAAARVHFLNGGAPPEPPEPAGMIYTRTEMMNGKPVRCYREK